MRIVAFALLCLVGGCQPEVTRPPQDNFTVHSGNAGIQPFVTNLEHAFGAKADSEELNLPDSDPAEVFTIRSWNVTVIIDPVPDDRCNPNASMHSTYKQGEYRVDLVYRTSSSEKREAAKRLVLVSAADRGLTAVPFKEC